MGVFPRSNKKENQITQKYFATLIFTCFELLTCFLVYSYSLLNLFKLRCNYYINHKSAFVIFQL